MKLISADINGFRNIESEIIPFSDGLNIITGDNAQGKTAVLEALYIFARGKSFRSNKEVELINFDKDEADISVMFDDGRRDVSMRVIYGKGEKRRLYYNGIEIRKSSEFIGKFRAVLFTPDHLSLIKGSPSDRRLFLDVALSQLLPSYIGDLKKYNYLMQSRNALFKNPDSEGASYKPLFETLAEQLAPVAATITRVRKTYCDKLGDVLGKYITELSDGKEISELSFESCAGQDGVDIKDVKQTTEIYYKKLTENLPREFFMKTTLYGPHKDDIDVKLNGHSSRRYCSQGQQRSLSLGFKLAEGDISKQSTGEYPVYLLDDVLGEFDDKRKAYFMSRLKDRQIIMTCASDASRFENAQTVITMNGGHVYR